MTEETQAAPTALALRPSVALLNPEDINIDREVAMLQKMRAVRDTVLISGVHYGTMPGVDRPFLQQPGAEVFYRVLNLRPRYTVIDSLVDPEQQYCYFLVKAEVVSIDYEVVVGESNGACSSFEYDENCRDVYMASSPDTTTVNCPTHGSQRARKFQVKGSWKAGCPVKAPAPLARTIQNVQSRAQKRAMVAAIRTVGCISEMFTQDEELVDRRRSAAARPVGPGSDGEDYDDYEEAPPANNRPQSKSGQGVRRAATPGNMSDQYKGPAPKAAPKAAAKSKPAAGGEPAKLNPKFTEEVKKGFTLIKEAGVSGAELRGWAEDRGLLQPGEDLTARVAYRFASKMDPPPASDEDAVAAFATAVLDMLKGPIEDEPPTEEPVDSVDGVFTEAPIDEVPFED